MFTTMCPNEHQTSDNLIVKDYCFIIEIYDKEPVKLIKQVKTAHSFLQSVSDQFHIINLKLAYVILQMAVKEFFNIHF